MQGYIALAVVVPRHGLGRPAEVIARARTLAALARRVQVLSPTARLALFDREPVVLCDGRPVRGTAREPGRTIYLCGPA